MEPTALPAAVQAQVVQALLAQIGAGASANLLALLGQNLEVVFQGMVPQGAQLVLPSGQTLVAQGELPFTPGTQLTLKVLPEVDGAVRLQIQGAQPPASPAVLHPLLNGEAQPLLARLEQPQAPESLAPLVKLLQQVLGPPEAPSALPTLPQIQEAVSALPPAMAQQIQQSLGLAPEMPLAQGIQAWMEAPATSPLPGTPILESQPGPPAATPNPEKSAELPQARPVLTELLQRFTQLIQQEAALPKAEKAFVAQWFRELLVKAGGPGATPAPPQVAGVPDPLPQLAEQVQAAVAALPPDIAQLLRQTLGLSPEQPLAQGLQAWVETAVSEKSTPPTATPVKAPQSPDEPQLPSPALALLGHRFAELVRQDPDIPKSQRDFVTSWFRDLLVKAGGREGPSPQLRPGETKPQALPEPGRPAAEARAQTSNVLAESRGIPGASVGAQAPLEEPAFWGKWVKGTLEALTDPKVSPKEAAFHAIQAKEGTAFFELPAPWLPQGVVQLWVESDAPGDTGTGEEVKRLFMGLHLSNLGETRLGLESAGKHLRVRVWTEHPERLAAQEASLVKELEETGQTVTLSILPLGTATPSVRAMAVGASWQGLG